MKKRILAYRHKIDAILLEGGARDWEALRADHLVQIAFFQHERLIHLIVTVLFALIVVVTTVVSVYSVSLGVLAIDILALILLVPYIFHYFLLENEVQRLYAQYDRIERACADCRLK